jgi:hypothetical protein
MRRARRSAPTATTYVVVYTTDPLSLWPADIGDDPAIIAAAHPGPGVVTWGICRRPQRNRARPGDLVVFFAADLLDERRPARYKWVGYATVDRKISQPDIWENEQYAGFRQYPNLLIRPTNNGYVHSESSHGDWIWRLTDMPGLTPGEFRELEATGNLGPDSRVGDQLVEIAANYVIFRPEDGGTFIAANPPVVAHAYENGQTEEWADGPAAVELRALLLEAGSTRTSLRTANLYTPHTPPPTLTSNPDDVRENLDRWVERHGIRQRTPLTHAPSQRQREQ